MGYTTATAKTFINHIAPLMQAEAKRRGYKIVSTAIAQAVIEGAAGTSSLAKNYHNHFGLKCGSKWKGPSVNMKTKEEYSVGTLTTIKDNFRVYPNDEEGVKGYYDFINTTRYANLKNATTPRQYAEFLKADGYATSSTYVNTLVNTVTKYGLDKYDTEKVVINDVTDIAIERPTLKRGSKGDIVRAWQIFLNLHGYCCGNADGVFGAKTETAIRAWQRDHNLIADGIVGPKTWASLPIAN
jgi:hypothetical protein